MIEPFVHAIGLNDRLNDEGSKTRRSFGLNDGLNDANKLEPTL
jgi:hypothetical protein